MVIPLVRDHSKETEIMLENEGASLHVHTVECLDTQEKGATR